MEDFVPKKVDSVEESSDAPTDTVNDISQAIDILGFGKFQVILSAMIGLALICDSMEVGLLTVLAPVLQCSSWNVQNTEIAFLTTLVF